MLAKKVFKTSIVLFYFVRRMIDAGFCNWRTYNTQLIWLIYRNLCANALTQRINVEERICASHRDKTTAAHSRTIVYPFAYD